MVMAESRSHECDVRVLPMHCSPGCFSLKLILMQDNAILGNVSMASGDVTVVLRLYNKCGLPVMFLCLSLESVQPGRPFIRASQSSDLISKLIGNATVRTLGQNVKEI